MYGMNIAPVLVSRSGASGRCNASVSPPSWSAPGNGPKRSEEHTSELQSHHDLHSFPTRRSSDLGRGVESLERGPKAVRIRRPRRFVIITHHIHIDVWNEYRPRVGVEVGGVRALQRQRLPAVLERAGKRPEEIGRAHV